ncbi:MAG: HlyD family secretion protein, partial [Gammaproteobacteria bacterium]|nr:HlyD family secretion protein [Gammaproteobacteria bacterium]
EVWVDANFKEPQLARMRIGQPVKLTADLYGAHVVYHGSVAGFGAGTGAAFSLLPAQNATGNWIKIVQRVPVRIALDSRELAAHPLQIGLSMKADVEVRSGTGLPRLQQRPTVAAARSTEVFGTSDAEATARVAAIIAANRAVPAAPPAAGRSPAKGSLLASAQR